MYVYRRSIPTAHKRPLFLNALCTTPTWTNLQRHSFLDLSTVLVSIEHENGITEDVHCIMIGKHFPLIITVTRLQGEDNEIPYEY